jgi:hypothetical protein
MLKHSPSSVAVAYFGHHFLTHGFNKVVDRVCQRILVALGEGDIVLAKVGIRSLACLTSAQCVQPFGEGTNNEDLLNRELSY